MSKRSRHERAADGVSVDVDVDTPYDRHEHDRLVKRISNQRRELKYLNRAAKRKAEKHVRDLAQKREQIAQLKAEIRRLRRGEV